VPWCPNCGVKCSEGLEHCPRCGAELVDAPPRDPERQVVGPEEPSEASAWLTAGVFTTPEAAEIARGYLHAAGIAAEIIDKEMHVQPYGMGLLGEVFLRVPRAELGRATRMLAAAERGQVALPDE
jgi:hypothetical protein